MLYLTYRFGPSKLTVWSKQTHSLVQANSQFGPSKLRDMLETYYRHTIFIPLDYERAMRGLWERTESALRGH